MPDAKAVNRIVRGVVALLALAGTLSPASAQAPLWFNGLGVSGGGGALSVRATPDGSPESLLLARSDSIPAGSLGAFLSLGTRRWAVTVPEFHLVGGVRDVSGLAGSVRVGGATAEFEPDSQSIDAYALMFGAQAALLPSGRVWVRGGIGSGNISSRIQASDTRLDVNQTSSTGLALSGGAGFSIWNKSTRSDRFMSVDVELHYLRISSDAGRVTAPSVRVGWRLQPFFIPR